MPHATQPRRLALRLRPSRPLRLARRLALPSRWALLGALLCLALPLPASAGEAPATPPAAGLVERFHSQLLEVMQLDSYAQRVAALDPAVTRTFDVGTIARISLGRHWAELSAEQQTDYAALMLRLIITTYAARFDNYSGQRFATLGEKPLPRSRAQVRTLLYTGSDEISLDYQLIFKAGVWQVYDVAAQGVSDLSLKRSAYSAAYAEGGLAAAQAEVAKTIMQNETGSPDGG